MLFLKITYSIRYTLNTYILTFTEKIGNKIYGRNKLIIEIIVMIK